MSDSTYPLFPISCFLGFVMVILPLPWHLKGWNAGTCYFMMWTSIGCLIEFINSIVWHGNVINHAPIWCEISTRLTISVSVGIPAASMCINRRLYSMTSANVAHVTVSDKWRNLWIDSAICVMLPLICIPLEFIVQGHRFNILEDIGCFPATFNTIPTFFLVYMWPVLLGMISFVYASLTLRAFAKRRAAISEFITAHSALNAHQYLRLMALATTEMMCTTPLAVFVIILNAKTSPVQPWRGWDDAHFEFNRIEMIPAIVWRSDNLTEVSFELSRWLNPACAFVFFAYFGFSSEARRHYRMAGGFFIQKVLRITPQTKYQKYGHVPPPVYARVFTVHVSRTESKFSPSSSVTASLPVYHTPPPPPMYRK